MWEMGGELRAKTCKTNMSCAPVLSLYFIYDYCFMHKIGVHLAHTLSPPHYAATSESVRQPASQPALQQHHLRALKPPTRRTCECVRYRAHRPQIRFEMYFMFGTDSTRPSVACRPPARWDLVCNKFIHFIDFTLKSTTRGAHGLVQPQIPAAAVAAVSIQTNLKMPQSKRRNQCDSIESMIVSKFSSQSAFGVTRCNWWWLYVSDMLSALRARPLFHISIVPPVPAVLVLGFIYVFFITSVRVEDDEILLDLKDIRLFLCCEWCVHKER